MTKKELDSLVRMIREAEAFRGVILIAVEVNKQGMVVVQGDDKNLIRLISNIMLENPEKADAIKKGVIAGDYLKDLRSGKPLDTVLEDLKKDVRFIKPDKEKK